MCEWKGLEEDVAEVNGDYLWVVRWQVVLLFFFIPVVAPLFSICSVLSYFCNHKNRILSSLKHLLMTN